MSVTCPKCAYVRLPTDTAPDYECPKCGIVYAKYVPRPPREPSAARPKERRLSDLVAMPPETKPLAPMFDTSFDPSKQAQQLPNTNTGLSAGHRVLLWAGTIIGGVILILQFNEPKNLPNEDRYAAPSSRTMPGSPEAVCYDKGMRIAAVYLASIRQASEVGLTASRVMNEGCERDSSSARCTDECKTGFQVEARRLLK